MIACCENAANHRWPQAGAWLTAYMAPLLPFYRHRHATRLSKNLYEERLARLIPR